MRRFQRVLYVEAHPRGSGRGFRSAARLAADHHADLTVLHVVEGPTRDEALAPGAAQRRSAILRRHRRLLAPLADEGAALGVPTAIRVVMGDLLSSIEEVARTGHPDVVVKVSDSRNPAHPWALARIDRKLIRECPAPVWLLDPAQHGSVRRVLAAVDVSEGRSPLLNRRIVRTAAEVADRAGAELRVGHAWSLIGEPILASPFTGVSRARLRAIRRNASVERRRRVEALIEASNIDAPAAVEIAKGRPVAMLREMARSVEADVVVVGSSGLTGLPRLLLGSVSERLVGTVPGAVLVVKDTPMPSVARAGLGARDVARSPALEGRAAGRSPLPA